MCWEIVVWESVAGKVSLGKCRLGKCTNGKLSDGKKSWNRSLEHEYNNNNKHCRVLVANRK